MNFERFAVGESTIGLKHHTNYDQLIKEIANGKDFWIHVSCRKNIKKNRKQIIRNLIKPALS